MKNYFTLLGACLIFISAFTQSPIWSVPSNCIKINLGGSFVLSLPMPYGSQSAFWSLRLDPQSPIYTDPNNSQIQRNVYDGRPADCVHNTGYDANGNLAFFIVDEYVFDKEGYLARTSRGRVATELAYNHLGRDKGFVQGGLF